MSHTSNPAAGLYDSTRRADGILARLERAVVSVLAVLIRWWRNLRFLLFTVFLLLAVVVFWLWVVSVVLALIRFVLHAFAVLLMWLAGGVPRAPGERPGAAFSRGMRGVWARRVVYYRQMARPAARGYVTLRGSARRFWRWHAAQKLAAIVAAVVFIGIPALYIVPRPKYVQLLDDNAIDHHEGRVRYLVHGVGLRSGKFVEYANERAPYLGKIDPQGLKSRLVPGRYYRLWVVGIRWKWLPTLYPNVIRATEVDAEGKTLDAPSRLVPHPNAAAVHGGD